MISNNYTKYALFRLFILFLFIFSPFASKAATLLSDDFTGTTIDTVKWTEIDPSGTVSQNGNVTISGSYTGGLWGVAGLDSKDTFSRTNLSVSANMSGGSAQLLGYGDRNFQSAGTAAYILDIVGGTSYALAWNNGAMDGGSNMACGATTVNSKYTITPTPTGFSVYKDTGGGNVLMCSAVVNTSITNKGIFLSSQDSATFDNVLVTGDANNSAPDAPTSLTPNAGNAQVTLSWTAPVSNGGSAITDYLVEYKLSTEPTTWTTFTDGVSTTTTATVTSLTNGLVYNFRVSAISAIGTSVPSSTANATPSLPTAPGAPTGLSGTGGNTQVTLSWTAPVSNGGSAITDYLVEYKLSTEPTTWTTFTDGVSTTTTATVTSLTNSLVYNFRVSTINAIGTSTPSTTANATPSIETPTTISNLAFWLDASDASTVTTSVGNVTQINDKSGNGKNATASGALSPSYVSNVQNGKSILRFNGSNYLSIPSSVTYRTIVVVGKFFSATFNDYNGIIGDITGTSPNNGHILNGNSGTTKLATATSNFASAYKNGDIISGSSGHDFSPINQYWIGTFELPANSTNTTSVIGALNGGAGRTWNGDIGEIIIYSRVLTNGERVSLENYLSTKWGIATSGPTVPDAPTALGASKGNSQITLSWTAPVDDGGSAILDYVVEYKLSTEPTTWTTFSDGTSTETTATVTGLTNDLSYNFRIKAVNAMGTSTASNTATKTPGLPTVPDAPTNVVAVEGNTQATITFTPPVDNGGASITSYTVTSSPGNLTATSSSSPIIITGLTNGTSYTFTVTATNSVGTSSASQVSNAITPSALGNQLTDSFTGTTIDTNKWNEYDPTGVGGTTGKIRQNGTLTIADSYSGSWGQNALISQDIFDATSLEISANMTAVSSPLIGYGDYNFGNSGKKAYLLYLTGPGSSILALSWEGAAYTSTSCGNADAGAAVYKMKVISGGFEVYKGGVLMCTHNTAVVVNNKPVFLQNSTTASTFDNIVVYGLAPLDTVPDAPVIGTATAGNASASVTFTAPSSNGGNTITGYTVTSSPGNLTATSSSSPITITGLTNGTSYTFTVKATNSQGDSIASSASNSVTPQLPEAPGQVTGLVATGFNKQVLLGWDAPSSGGTPTDYIVEYKLSSASSWSTFSDGTSIAKKVIVTGLINASAYDFRISASNDGNPGIVSASVSATPDDISNLSFVITGESNSGGIGLNSAATAGEIAPRSAVQILELTSGNFLFENLDIGTNNLRDHAGLSGYYDCCHGLELGLANGVEANAFPDNPQIYLIKTGQGGSQVSQWNYAGGYFTKFLQRTNAAKTQIPVDRKWVVWMSIGINDGIAGTNITNFKNDLTTYIDNIKAELPGAIIIMTQFQSMPASSGYPTINTALADVAALEPNVYVVDTTTATATDGANHWTYAGLKTVASLMTTATKNVLGLNYPGLPTDLNAIPSSSSVALSWTAPIANGGSAITDYLIEYKTNSGSTWNTFSDGTSTTTSTTVTGLSGGTAYNFRVSAMNSNGAGNSISTNSTTTDGDDPIISSISYAPSDTSATITWTTDEASSSIVEYGLTNTYGEETTEEDTSPRVTSHSVNIGNLIACTIYHYRVISTDGATNTATGNDNVFTTTGCTADVEVISNTNEEVTTDTGGTIDLSGGDSNGLTLTIPPDFSSLDAIFQAQQLDSSTVIAVISTPTGLSSVGSYVYQLQALTDTSTLVSSFDEPLTITFSYSPSDIPNIDESTLSIYRYDGTTWNALSDCSVNTSLNTVTCTTTHFSLFGLFGLESAEASSTRTTGSGIHYGCKDPKALNYEEFSAHNPLLCKYQTITPTLTRNLKYKMEGDDVKALQVYLNTHGYVISTNGPGSLNKETTYFGQLTKKAVIRFQMANKLIGDGVVGPMTKSYLK